MTSAEKPRRAQNSSSSNDETVSNAQTTKVGDVAISEEVDMETELIEKWAKFAAAFEVSQTKPIRVSSIDSLRQKK